MPDKLAFDRMQAEAFQRAASKMLSESVERGDQDAATVAWAVGFLLRAAADAIRTAEWQERNAMTVATNMAVMSNA